MNYYLDTEFLEGRQKKRLFGVPYGVTPNTIDLISIGIVSEDGREYYAISKDFNLEEAWNRYDILKGDSTMVKSIRDNKYKVKNYWIKYNVLMPLCKQLAEMNEIFMHGEDSYFTYKTLKELINRHGKSNKQIAEEVKEFIYNPESVRPMGTEESINFYTYYGAYDHVVFCWLFGKMNDLPTGFPKYSKDLQQIKDDLWKRKSVNYIYHYDKLPVKWCNNWESHPDYPKQFNQHSALDDARWNKKLHEFLKSV